MKIYLSYKFELLFNNPQIILACQTAGSCRFIWNEWLALKKEKWENNKELFRITTSYPKFEIKASKEHLFFIRTNNGIIKKPLSEIKEGDFLIMPEKINLNLEDENINFIPEIKQKFNMKKINIPKKINCSFSRILGYYLGDEIGRAHV